MSDPRSSRGLRIGLGVTLFVLFVATGCGKKDPPPVTPEKPGPGQPNVSGPGTPAAAGNNALATLIPGDIPAFGCVNVHKLWESAEGQKARKLAENVKGARLIREIEDETGVAPDNVDHMAFVFTEIEDDPIVIVSTIKPYDLAKVRATIEMPKTINGGNVPKIREEEYKGKKLIIQPLLTFSKVGQTIGGPVEKGVPKDKVEFSKDKVAKDKRPAPAVEDKSDAPGRCLVVVSDRTFAIGRDTRAKKWLDKLGGTGGPLAGAIAKVGENHCVVVGFNPAVIPERAAGEMPPEYKALLKAKYLVATADVGKETKIQAKVEFPDEATAKEGEKAIAGGINMISLFMPEMMKKLDREAAQTPDNPFMPAIMASAKDFQSSLPNLKPTREGAAVQLALAVKTDFPELTAADKDRIRIASMGVQHSNNVKQLAIAVHNWVSTYGDRLPPAAICDKDGKPILSWRVLLLPYVEEDRLFRQFKLDEPWDGPNNRKLLDKMPKVFRMPGADAKENRTHYQLLVGPNTLYPDYGKAADAAASGRNGVPAGLRAMASRYTIANIPDGTSNTILIVEATDPVPWTKPDDVMYDPQKPLPKLGKMYPDKILVGMADGSTRLVDKKKVSEKTLRNAIDPADGNPLGSDW